VTRRFVIDLLLAALGWDVHALNRQIVEEARTHGQKTLFLDYLGVTLEARIPLMIFEAKAWAKPLINASALGRDQQGSRNTASLRDLIVAGLQHCKSRAPDGESPVTAEWTEWLGALLKYVKAIHAESGHIVSRVAISSGQWLVVFSDPEAIFLKEGNIPDAAIRVFVGPEIIEKSDEIFDLIARWVVTEDVPAYIRPSQLPSFTTSAEIIRAYRALWVTREAQGPHFQVHPQVILNVALVVERRDGILLTVLDDQLEHLALPCDYARLSEHLRGVAALSNLLVDLVQKEIGVELIPASIQLFPGFRPAGFRSHGTIRASPATRSLVKSWTQRADEFLLVLGADTHYLRAAPDVHDCVFHDWGECRVQHQSQGSGPVLARSVSPAAFFFSGEGHHCAHRIVHDRREGRCQIQPFEQFLCCRACVLQSYCWPGDELQRLPCGGPS
jgi:hypothetical protein